VSQNNDRIDKYLANAMTAQERKDFEAELLNNPSLRNEILLIQKGFIALQLLERKELKKRLQQREAKINNPNQKSDIPVRNKMLWILAVIGSLVAWFIFRNINTGYHEMNRPGKSPDSAGLLNTPVADSGARSRSLPDVDTLGEQKGYIVNGEKLFAAHFKTFKDESMETDVRGEGELSEYEKFIQFYTAGLYDKALDQFEKIDPSMQKNDNTLFIKANALLAERKVKEAINLLDQLKERNMSRYREDIIWDLALCKLYSNQIDETRKLLHELKLKNHQKALQLLKELE